MDASPADKRLHSEIMFFLGAGASVPAGIEGVEGMARRIQTELSINHSQNYIAILNEIMKLLKKQENRNKESESNIENILEIVERIENRAEDTISILYDEALPVIEEIDKLRMNNILFSSVIKNAIKQQAATSTIQVDYLSGVLDFLMSWRPLNIFSTNHDIVIERLCENYGKSYTDGFTKGWSSTSFEDDVDIRLYKLHGSVTWSRSEKGRYSKNEIVLNHASDSHTNIITGDVEIPLILYPGKKLDYSEPVFDTLMELKNSLNTVKYVFVLGYRFRDAHLRELFQNVAYHNQEFIVILVSPSAYSIYKDRLEYLRDDKFRNKVSDRRSSLYSRVICLPYKVQNIMPHMKKEILDNLIIGDSVFKKNKEEQHRGTEVNWIECLGNYAQCEYIQRVDQIVDSLDWFDLEKKDWKATFEIAFKTLINSIHSSNTHFIAKWKGLFRRTTDAYSPTSLVFSPMVTPAEIRFEFKRNKYTCSIPHPDSLLEGLTNLIAFLDKKEMYMGRSIPLTDLKHAIVDLRAYFQSWINQKVKYPKYYEMRNTNNPEMDRLKALLTKLLSDSTDARQEEVASVILSIEALELRKKMDHLDECINNYETSIKL